jgi:ferredoxin
MPAITAEKAEFLEENIPIIPFATPKRIIAEAGQVRRIEFERNTGHGPHKNSGSADRESDFLEVDAVIIATGETADLSGFPRSLKVKAGRLAVDAGGATTRKTVFAGGSATQCGATVSEAIASGRRAAFSIHRFLQGGADQDVSKPAAADFGGVLPEYVYLDRKLSGGNLPAEERIRSFDEVRRGTEEEEVLREARRCFGCALPPGYNPAGCRGCSNCEQKCPAGAITIERREIPFSIGVDPRDVDPQRVAEVCRNARIHPQQVVCYCTKTTAEEIVAAILRGAKTLGAVSLVTGARTGCTVLCVQSVVKLLRAAGEGVSSSGAEQRFYGDPITVWDVDAATKEKYARQGYHFDDDRRLYEKVAEDL